jgi:hypothetical protein
LWIFSGRNNLTRNLCITRTQIFPDIVAINE